VDGKAGGDGDRFDAAVSLDLLADLQAGLLDDLTAARLRQRARTDPDVTRGLAALDRVRRDVARLGGDAASAPEVPAALTARVGAELASRPTPSNEVVARRGPDTAHAARAPGARLRDVAAAAGVAAVIAAGVIGTAMLTRSEPGPPLGTGPTASSMKVPRPPGGVPLPDEQILALLRLPPDLVGLVDPQRRASCLGGLGYPASTPVLGARPLAVRGRPGVLLLLPSDAPKWVDAVVVAPNCSSVDTGLLARTTVSRP
jgi:hypothetical protein